jgi:hypothetical protein
MYNVSWQLTPKQYVLGHPAGLTMEYAHYKTTLHVTQNEGSLLIQPAICGEWGLHALATSAHLCNTLPIT